MRVSDRRRRGVDATGQPLRDFLQQPAVAVRIYQGNSVNQGKESIKYWFLVLIVSTGRSGGYLGQQPPAHSNTQALQNHASNEHPEKAG
jgi:hypothetical protein